VRAEPMSSHKPTSGWRARCALLALFALFFVPIVGAFLLNALAPSWLPFGRVNHGELVQPPLEAGLHALRPYDGPDWPEVVAAAPWTLVYIDGPQCADSCQQALVSMRQARLALGKDADRVSRWWLASQMPDTRQIEFARQIDPGLRVGVFGHDAAVLVEQGTTPAVHLVDPAGYLILRYDVDIASSILKDLKRLLRISAQG
jgi:hypothetical protein